MSQAVIHLSDVYVQKGYQDKPQVSFKANEGSDYGVARFKVSHKKGKAKGAEKAEYDNYSIEWRGVKSDSKAVELMSQPGVRVALYGEVSQEEYEGKKFTRVTCEGRNSVTITAYGEQKGGAAPSAPASSNDDL